jgi:phage anti-repressor protein
MMLRVAQYRFKDVIKLADRLAVKQQNDRHDGESHNDNQVTIDDQAHVPIAAKRERSSLVRSLLLRCEINSRKQADSS